MFVTTASAELLLRFEYSGHILSVLGDRTDGSLGFTDNPSVYGGLGPGDPVSGSFVFDADTPYFTDTSGNYQWANSVEDFRFGPVIAAGTNPGGYSSFLLGQYNTTYPGAYAVQAYQQVSNPLSSGGSIYDTFEFTSAFAPNASGNWWESFPNFASTSSPQLMLQRSLLFSPCCPNEHTIVYAELDYKSVRITSVPDGDPSGR